MKLSLQVLALALLAVSRAEAQVLAPRTPLPKTPVLVAPDPAGLPRPLEHRLVVKFTDDLRARADRGSVASLGGRDLSAVRELAARRGLRFSPLIRTAQARLDALEDRAARRSGKEQPDLAGMLVAELEDATPAALVAVGNELQGLDEVEFAYVQTLGVPPPGDIAPVTPDLVAQQGYRGDDPGMGASFAWGLGLSGSGVRLSDCEYGWIATHEDLEDVDLHLEPGQTIHPQVVTLGWDEHGTAVMGEITAPDNGYGVSGMAPGASIHTYPEWTVEGGPRRVTCITNAIADSAAGDVVLLEMQTTGAGGGYGPAELDLAVWTVTKTGTDAGVIVVGAAGNGDQDLDSAAYAPYRNRGDSGAILVGAGSNNVSHNKLSFSTYGARVDVQGWGAGVFTLGYGTYAEYGGDPNQRYTNSFSGTSSASPFVASACLLIQEHAMDVLGAPLSPLELRDLLIATGRPQGTGGHIGPFVYLPDALPAVEDLGLGTRYCDPAVPNSTGQPGDLVVVGSATVAADDLLLRATQLPPASNIGYFLMGQGTNTFTPPGAAGPICITPGLLRYLPPVNNTTELGGGFERSVGTSGPVSSAIQPGQTWNFQAWHRDGMGLSNLTNAVSVAFQ